MKTKSNVKTTADVVARPTPLDPPSTVNPNEQLTTEIVRPKQTVLIIDLKISLKDKAIKTEYKKVYG